MVQLVLPEWPVISYQKGKALRKFNRIYAVKEGEPGYDDNAQTIKDAMTPNGTGMTLAIGSKNGKTYPLTNNPEDIAGAKGLQEWIDSGMEGSPNLMVLRAVFNAGITEVNGCSVAEALTELEQQEAMENAPVCQCAAAMYVTAFGMVLNLLEDLGADAMENGNTTEAWELATAIAILTPLANKAVSRYTGVTLEGDTIHDLFHSLGLFCPDKDDWEGKPEGFVSAPDTSHFSA